MPDTTRTNSKVNLSIVRVFDILDLFTGEAAEIGISEIAVKTGINRSTVIRLVSTMVSQNYLVRCANSSKYRLGARLAALTKSYFSHLDITQAVQPYLRKLSELTDELITLCAIRDDMGEYLSWIESTKYIRMVIEEQYMRFSLHAGAPGKMLLSCLPDEEITEIIGRKGMPRFTANTITDFGDLMIEIKKIRAAGFAMSRSEHMDYGNTVSAAVRDFTGKAVASLNISWVGDGDSMGGADEYCRLVRDAAGKLSADLGYFSHNNTHGR